MDPKLDFCIDAGMKKQIGGDPNAGDPLDYLAKVKDVVNAHAGAIRELLSNGEACNKQALNQNVFDAKQY